METEPSDPYFFEILIYTGSPDALRKFLDRKLAKWIAPLEEVKDYYPRTYRGALRKFERDFGHPLNFNDVVGGIGLSAHDGCVRGTLYFSVSKRIQRGGRHRVIDCGVLFEWEPALDMTSTEIFENVLENLLTALEHPMLCRRWLELQPFRQAGPRLDWYALLGMEKAEIPESVSSL